MTDSQLTEIRNYLLSKKLPIDILLELQDHFISQISDSMKERNLDFENAFTETKLSWSKEMKILWNYNGCGTNMATLVKDMTKKNIKLILIESVAMAIVSTAFLMICLKYSNKESSYLVYNVFVIVMLSMNALIYVFNFKKFNLITKFRKTLLNIHQKGLPMVLLSIPILISPLATYGKNFFVELHNYVKGDFSASGFAGIIMLLCYFTLYFAGLTSMIKYLNKIKRTENFLKNFKRI